MSEVHEHAASNDVEARIAAIKTAMGDGSYWEDAKMRAEYIGLLDARTKRDAEARATARLASSRLPPRPDGLDA